MPRPAKIWLRKSDGFFYMTHRGRKARMSADRKEAELPPRPYEILRMATGVHEP